MERRTSALPASGSPIGIGNSVQSGQAVAEETESLQPTREELSDARFLKRTLLVVGLILFTGLMLAMIWYASDAFLVLFAGILLAVLLRAPTNWLTSHTPLNERWSLAIAVLLLLGTIFLVAYLFSVPLADQLGQLVATLPRALERARQWLAQYMWTRPLWPLFAELTRLKVDSQFLWQAGGVISSAVTAVGGSIVVLFIGIYLAAQPRLYQRGLMHLLPRRKRPRAYEVLDEIAVTLRWWLVGRMITMLTVGIAAGIGLWWLDVPLAFTLAVLSGVLEFIPYIGPTLSAVPALLVSFNIDLETALYVLALYVVIQSAENYLLSPIVEQRAVSLPPALVIFSTLLLAAIAGPLGVILASPLTATGIVAIKLLYVEDVVEQPAKTQG